VEFASKSRNQIRLDIKKAMPMLKAKEEEEEEERD